MGLSEFKVSLIYIESSSQLGLHPVTLCKQQGQQKLTRKAMLFVEGKREIMVRRGVSAEFSVPRG